MYILYHYLWIEKEVKLIQVLEQNDFNIKLSETI